MIHSSIVEPVGKLSNFGSLVSQEKLLEIGGNFQGDCDNTGYMLFVKVARGTSTVTRPPRTFHLFQKNRLDRLLLLKRFDNLPHVIFVQIGEI